MEGTNMRACGSGNSPVSNLMRTSTTKLALDPESFPTEATIIWFETGGCQAEGNVRGVMYTAFPDGDPDYANRTDLVTFATASEPIPAACPNGYASNLTFSLPNNRADGRYTLQIEYTSPTGPTSSVTMIQCADVFVVSPRSSGTLPTPSRLMVWSLGLAIALLSTTSLL